MTHHWLRSLWIFLGLLFVVFICWSSLTPVLEIRQVFFWQDKLMHLLAYLGLGLWFFQLSHKIRQLLLISFCLFLLGLAIEYLQGLTSYRYREGWDLIANTAGVLLALGITQVMPFNLLDSAINALSGNSD